MTNTAKSKSLSSVRVHQRADKIVRFADDMRPVARDPKETGVVFSTRGNVAFVFWGESTRVTSVAVSALVLA